MLAVNRSTGSQLWGCRDCFCHPPSSLPPLARNPYQGPSSPGQFPLVAASASPSPATPPPSKKVQGLPLVTKAPSSLLLSPPELLLGQRPHPHIPPTTPPGPSHNPQAPGIPGALVLRHRRREALLVRLRRESSHPLELLDPGPFHCDTSPGWNCHSCLPYSPPERSQESRENAATSHTGFPASVLSLNRPAWSAGANPIRKQPQFYIHSFASK